MNKIPIVFAFDNNLILTAAVCIYSLLASAKPDTFYEIFIIHHKDISLDLDPVNKVLASFDNHSLRIIKIDGTFDNAFQIRGITTATYYRLLIPQLLPEYDKVLYSDVDVIFREDLSEIFNIDLKDNLFGGVCALAHLDSGLFNYYSHLGLEPKSVVYAGNLVINCKEIRSNPLITEKFLSLAQNNYKYQDLDVINLSSKSRIYYLPLSFCITTDITQAIAENNPELHKIWSPSEIEHAKTKGIVHYNGQKPWIAYCINFDIWWEYYRKSPVFDPLFYYSFFRAKLDDYDSLSLWKRIKILIRFFKNGRKK